MNHPGKTRLGTSDSKSLARPQSGVGLGLLALLGWTRAGPASWLRKGRRQALAGWRPEALVSCSGDVSAELLTARQSKGSGTATDSESMCEARARVLYYLTPEAASRHSAAFCGSGVSHQGPARARGEIARTASTKQRGSPGVNYRLSTTGLNRDF